MASLIAAAALLVVGFVAFMIDAWAQDGAAWIPLPILGALVMVACWSFALALLVMQLVRWIF